MAEEPQNNNRFDTTDVDAEAPRTAATEKAPKKPARKGPPPIPVEALRPRTKNGPIASGGRLNASVSGENAAKDDEPYAEITIEAAPEPVAEKLTPSMEAARDREARRSHAIELHDAHQEAQAEFNHVQELTAKRSKEISEELSGKNYDADAIFFLTDAIYRKEGLNDMYDKSLDKLSKARSTYESAYADWEKALGPKYETAETNEVIEAIVASHRQPDFSAQEEGWFKKGEDDEAHQLAEARATIERGGKGELIVENAGDIEASVKEAAALFKKGDISSRDFSVEDYAYLLKERVRIDKELEGAGWWKARQLRKELNQVLKGGYNGAPNGLDGYKKQVMDAKAGNVVARQAETDRASRASGAPAKKLPFWERFRMTKGR